jgi:excisionase family DNA binding protein
VGISIDDQFLSVGDLAALLGVSRSTVYEWRYTGNGPRGIRIGRQVRFARSDVEAWLEARADER